MNQTIRSLCLIIAMLAAMECTAAERFIKDLTDVESDDSTVLSGLGLVTGLNGTGGDLPITREFFINLRQRYGIPVDPLTRSRLRNDNRLTTGSISVVYVSGKMRSTDTKTIDVSVAALDEATDLNNGSLVATPLLGVDKEVYAVASGRVFTGGIVAGGAAATVQKNHPTAGRAQANIVRRIPECEPQTAYARLLLRDPDYETAVRIRNAINDKFFNAARIDEPGIVRVAIPPRFFDYRHEFISLIQREKVVPDTKARVVINPQTGTVIVNDAVTISRVAIMHGNITVMTGESPLVSQPLPASRGETVVVPRTEIDVVEQLTPLTVVGGTTTVTDLAEALNALEVPPQDLISIFLELKKIGAIHAEVITN